MTAAAIAPLPEMETERLAALHQCHILDTLPETDYDDLVFLAAQICGAPIALISLIDAERQWFKARFGIEADQTARSDAFCAHAILRPDELMIVSDATKDSRFADHPMVLGGPKIRFYAGAPVVVTPPADAMDNEEAPESSALALGTICVVDRAPRELTPAQERALHALSRQVGNLLDLRLRRVLQEESNRRLAESAERLAESERRLQEAQRFARIGYWEYDILTEDLLWSDEIFRLFGLDPATSTPSLAALAHIYHPDDVTAYAARVEKAMVDGRPYESDLRVIQPGGALRWMHVHGRGICDADGKVVRLLGTMQDITERKETEERLLESERRLREAQTTARIGSWEYDVLTEEVTWSDEIFHLTEMEQGKPDLELLFSRIHPEDTKQYLAIVERTMQDGKPYEYDLRILREDGSTRWLHAQGRGLPDEQGRIVRLRGTVQEITERKEAENQLREMTDDLKRSNTALERSNEALREFTSVASHDLKEPLRKIQTFGGRLKSRLDKLGADAPTEAADYLERMTGAAGRMQALIDDLLELARVSQQDGDAQRRERVDLSVVAGEVLSDLEASLARTGGRVKLGRLPYVYADPLQMRQLLQNLIGNALKYHRTDVPPVVELEELSGTEDNMLGERVWDKGAGFVAFVVRDNGIGFEPEHAERIFAAFERVAGRGYEGTGVGLAICKKIIEAHGGNIRAQAVPGQGATFTVTLPASPL